MNVLHIFDHNGIGGAQRIIAGIQTKRSDDIFLGLNNKIPNIIQINNVIFPKSRGKFNLLSVFEISKIIKRNQIEIIHCHLFKSQLLSLIIKIFLNNKLFLIFHEHGEIFLNKKSYNLFLKFSNKFVSFFISISKATEKLLINYAKIPKNKISIIYNPITLFSMEKKICEKLESKKTFTVGFAARLEIRKGWLDFYNVAMLIAKNNANIFFKIAGDGNDSNKLNDLISKDNNPNIIYLGNVRDMVSFYNSLDCFVIPSHFEPMGLTQLEAQAMGVPVIASNVPGLNEVINDQVDCLMFEAKNINDLANKITRLYNDEKLRKRLVEAGKENVKKYSLDEYTVELDKLYRRSLNEKIN
ncbi:MAG TPA: glycosyltransferase family 4 protein [Spirochaetota bacterium]|jgi:glycosyltransferase involved in cell wall biosynthesis|nr:MAG: N,N'-diacetylbacillosaminyl-diphospho-undecaprenol alpha-1,3-N-acetylgalactosaminyltransferase [Spirochaetes bacterium ADurb.Bin133]HNZ25786.1 glycosyltransferase family 4 protein [Spirochaetota bacterium]HPY86996.1 glycosyltransferase family 4 protein [Spirochaetota bacterium]